MAEAFGVARHIPPSPRERQNKEKIFFIWIRGNPLKSLDSESKEIQAFFLGGCKICT
jgi:hypothetical protein